MKVKILLKIYRSRKYQIVLTIWLEA
jgi:hypothetical protein